MIFKCKICGGSLDVKQDEKIMVCEYCGVRQTIPNFIEPKTQEIYNRANAYLIHNEFDKAENLYNQILFNNKEDSDTYWNILMCRYGVTYVKDPATGKYIPTCNRTLYSPIFNDENYKNAIKYADEKQKELYIHNAKIIDDIQKGILAVSKKEKPFDIFISYKETDISGIRTKDSVVAQDLYEKLTAEGYKVFFSRITLEDKIGIEYEPYIYAALASSKVMITISSSKENIEAVWVKNEWSRFLSFAGKDSEKTLIPLYFNMGKEDLPDEFAHITSYDMKMEGFEQDLIRGIKKLIPLPVMLLERKKKFYKNLKIALVVILILAIIGGVASIQFLTKKTKNIPASGETIAEEITNIEETSPEYQAAMQLYYDKNYPEATWAFEALGDYKDAKEMKEKCELSWRKSLATVYTRSYHINPNGTVEVSDEDFGNSAQINNIEIEEHGKICSITEFSNTPHLLYKDGYVGNADSNSTLGNNMEWNDVVQFCGVGTYSYGIVGLKSDGTMVYKCSDDLDIFGIVDETWLKEIESWENIVSFYYDFIGTHAYGGNEIIVGIKSDGTLVSTQKIDEGSGHDKLAYGDVNKILTNFTNVKRIYIKQIQDLKENGNGEYGLNVITISKDNILSVYKKGSLKTQPADDIIDVYYTGYWTEAPVYYLKSNGELIDSVTGNVIQKDIVNISENQYTITRNGSVYSHTYWPRDYKREINHYENIKVYIYDEWLERLK